jgi:hypothetical protein
MENYEKNKIAFGILFDLIYEYEKTAPELVDFNNRMKELDDIEKLKPLKDNDVDITKVNNLLKENLSLKEIIAEINKPEIKEVDEKEEIK